MSAAAAWLIAGYAGLAGFFVLEGVTREPGSASSLDSSGDDRGTTRLIIIAYLLAAVLPLPLHWVPEGRLPLVASPVGLVLELTGIGLRGWSMRALGSFYTRTLRTEGNEHAVINTGPYRLIRHPGYAGSLLIWTGFALTSRNVPSVVVAAALLGLAYQRRITAEEHLLRRSLPGYPAYSDRTKRLIPYIW